MPYELASTDPAVKLTATPYEAWSDKHFRLAAELTIDPSTNGGLPSDIQLEVVAQVMKAFPCPWLLVESDVGALLCGMNPSNGPEGSLHLAARGFSAHNAIHVLRHFTEQFPHTDIHAFTLRPQLEAITRRLGFTFGARDGQLAIWWRHTMNPAAAGGN